MYYRLSLPWRSPAASHSHKAFTHTQARTHTRTQAVQHANPLHSVLALSFSSSYVGLFVAAMPELAEENRENKAKTKKKKKKKGGENKAEEVGEGWGGDE